MLPVEEATELGDEDEEVSMLPLTDTDPDLTVVKEMRLGSETKVVPS